MLFNRRSYLVLLIKSTKEFRVSSQSLWVCSVDVGGDTESERCDGGVHELGARHDIPIDTLAPLSSSLGSLSLALFIRVGASVKTGGIASIHKIGTISLSSTLGVCIDGTLGKILSLTLIGAVFRVMLGNLHTKLAVGSGGRGDKKAQRDGSSGFHI